MTARYTYLADATKLEVVDGDGWGYDYLGSLVYRKNDDDTYTLESTPFACGRIVRNSSGSYRINGFVTDHLGSIRTVYDVETGDIIERNDYYPFGKRLNNSLAMSPTNRYRFSGKVARGSQRTFLCSRPEQQGFSPPVQQVVANVNLLDFGARMYDDEICRWTTMDPFAILFCTNTPYQYCLNNPVAFIDPFGLWTTTANGMLAQEEGDTVETLADYLNLPVECAQIIFDSQCYMMYGEDITPSYCCDYQMTPAYCWPPLRNEIELYGYTATAHTSTTIGMVASFEHYSSYTIKSNGKRVVKSHDHFYGNQHVDPKRIIKYSKVLTPLKRFGIGLGMYATFSDITHIPMTVSSSERGQVWCDLYFDGVGFIPGSAPIVVVYYMIPKSGPEYDAIVKYVSESTTD